ncbi:hypothetical protein [Haladaptatus salinisoli]|uniref:hypothetical protein n=1 Tax=Haladaptatus salinisoli TaxID=2884876 RepID=UPI001D09C83B|nr:hypothetical protein [Haladaptatus salinisoli]
MTNETDDREGRNSTEASRRTPPRPDALRKAIPATGALALGLGSAGSASAQPQNVLVYTYDYHPNVQFRVTDSIEQSTTVRLLRRPGGTDVPEISQPDDYNGYVIRYLLRGRGRRGNITAFVFGRDLVLSPGDRRRFSEDAAVFSSTLNLLGTTIRGRD